MCYVYTKSSEFCHRRCTLPYLPTLEQHWTADSLLNVPAVHCIMKAISQDFTFQEESSIPTNSFFFFFFGSFQFLFTSPSAGVTHCYKHKWWRRGNSSFNSKKKQKSCFSCLGRTSAIIAVAGHWARKMRQLWEVGWCDIKWALSGDEGIHWPTTECGVVPLGLRVHSNSNPVIRKPSRNFQYRK